MTNYEKELKPAHETDVKNMKYTDFPGKCYFPSVWTEIKS